VNPYSKLKVYLAAPFEERPTMLEFKYELERRGVEVTSTWLTPDDSLSMNQLAKSAESMHHECFVRAIKDFEDIDRAHFFVLYKPKPIHKVPTTGGHHVETGYALGTGKPVIIFGARENVFHYSPLVSVVTNVDELCRELHIEGNVREEAKEEGRDFRPAADAPFSEAGPEWGSHGSFDGNGIFGGQEYDEGRPATD
jgi:hypothetical protein